MSSDRDYKSYFPVAVTTIKKRNGVNYSGNAVTVNDKLRIRNNEIIPADGILMNAQGFIDYSFLTANLLR